MKKAALKLLFVCPTGFGTSKNGMDLGHALERRGHEVTFLDLDLRPAWLKYTPKPLRGMSWKLACENYLNTAVLDAARSHKSQAVFFLSGFGIAADTLHSLKLSGTITIAYWVDDPLQHKQALKNAHNYELFLTNDRQSLPSYFAAGVNAKHLPSAADPNLFFPLETEKSIDISFIGTHSVYRESIVKHLLDFNVQVFGPGWAKNSSIARKHTNEGVFGGKTNEIYNQSRINLNIHTWFGAGSAMNLRLFEVPLAGAFLLTDWVAESDEAYEDGVHISNFRTPDELREKVAFYLSNPMERERVAASGRTHALAHHTYDQRAVVFESLCMDMLRLC